MISSPSFIEQSLAFIAGITDIDFSKFDLDKELPHLTTNGEQGSLDMFAQWGSGKKLRQLVIEASGGLLASVELIGTPDRRRADGRGNARGRRRRLPDNFSIDEDKPQVHL